MMDRLPAIKATLRNAETDHEWPIARTIEGQKAALADFRWLIEALEGCREWGRARTGWAWWGWKLVDVLVEAGCAEEYDGPEEIIAAVKSLVARRNELSGELLEAQRLLASGREPV